MKPKSIRRFFGMQSYQSLALVVAVTAFAGNAQATTYVWSGGTSSAWTLAGNWTPSGAAPYNLTAGHRLSVSNAAANPLIYDATLGTTVYGATGVRGLVVGSVTSGAMSITGGTFSSAGSDTLDVIGNGTGTGVLTIAGGNYIGPSLGSAGSIGTSMGLAGSGVGTINVNSGSATLSILTLNAATATINLNGGTLALNNIVRSGGNNNIYFNGGTLKPRVSSATFFPEMASTSAFVKSGGVIVDTDIFDVTISEPLLTDSVSTGGGITKNGVGVLSLGAVSTTTGPAVVNTGGLGVSSGAASWAPSSLSHSGDQLNFNLGVYSPANAVPINTAALTLNSAVTVNISGSNFPPLGQIKLLDYGTKSGSGSLTLGNVPSGLLATLGEDTVNGFYYLDVSLPPGTPYTWSAGSGDWDTTSLNWNSNSAAYSEPALVTFPDLSSGGSVNVTADFTPVAVTLSNNTGNDYSFSGSAITGSAVLIKDGTGTATFANPLTFTGGTYVNNGRVSLTDNNLSSDSITIESGAFLTYDNASAVAQGPSSSTGQFLFGTGTFEKKGVGTLTVGNATGPLNWNFSAGAVIDVQDGTVICSGISGANNWASNKASLNIASSATFDGFEANVTVDALTGSGIYQGGNFGPRDLKVGVNNGSGTFSGTIKGKPGSPASCVSLYKLGTGEQTLDGSLTINTTTTYGGQRTLLVTGGTLNLNPTLGSVIGTTGSANSGSVDISPGQADLATVNQSSGTLAMNTFWIGNQGRATYSISGGIVNTTQINLAFTGPNNGGGAVFMNVSDTAAVNIHSNGGILMGQYYGRPVTVTQTGGDVVFYSDAGVTRGGTGSLQFKSSSTTPTYNLNGGTLSIPAITWAANTNAGFGGGNGTLSFNGGTLQITSAAFAVPTGPATPGNGQSKIVGKIMGDEVTPDSGAIIDNYGLAVTFAAPILHGPVGTFDGGLKLATSVPGGSLTLSGVNSYTGNTTVVSGNTLILPNDGVNPPGKLHFVLDGVANNKITGSGAVTLNGSFTIDTSLAAPTNGQSWTLVNVSTLAESYGSTFTIDGFTEAGSSGVHTMTDGSSNVWTFTESTGVLSVSVPSVGGYASWIGGFTVSDPSAGGDPDNDGMKNLLEYALNGNPSVSDPAILPSVSASGANFVFTFNRLDVSETDTTQTFEYGTNLIGWTGVSVATNYGPDGNGVSVVIAENGTAPDFITVTVPKSLAPGGKLFGRLKVSQP